MPFNLQLTAVVVWHNVNAYYSQNSVALTCFRQQQISLIIMKFSYCYLFLLIVYRHSIIKREICCDQIGEQI